MPLRSQSMRFLVLTALVWFSPGLWAQGESLGNDGPLVRAVHLAESLRDAEVDAARDSLNASLKAAVREVLEADGALSADLTALPLSRVDAPDGTFRLITWNVPYADGHHGYEGLLLMKERRGTSLYELRDQTRGIDPPELAELGPEKWFGAVYYAVVPVKRGGKTWYTLLGWKGHSRVQTHKVIEVLSFRGGKPRFGAPLFGEGRLKQQRVVFRYGFQVTMALRPVPGADRIVLDHLSPSRADLEGQYAFYGPDLSYDAYQWDGRSWVFERDVDAKDLERSGKPWNAPPKAPGP